MCSNNVTDQQSTPELSDQQIRKAITQFEKHSRVFIDVNAQDKKTIIKAALKSMFTNPKYNIDSGTKLSTYLQLELNATMNNLSIQPTVPSPTNLLAQEFQLKLSKDLPKPSTQNYLITLLQELAVASVDPSTGMI